MLRRVVSAPELPALNVEAVGPWGEDSIRSSPAWSSSSLGDLSDFDACSISSRSRASTSCEASDDEEDRSCRLAPEPDWAARCTRAHAENTWLLSTAEDLMDSRIRAPFNQQHLIEALVCPHDPEAAGICLGLSMEWLAACHARPTQSAHECTSVVGDIDQARRALVMQRAYMDEFASEPALRRPVNRAFCKVGIGIDPYRRFTCHPSVEPVIDVAERVASHISRHGPYHLLSFSTDDAGHGIACIQQANGSFCVFDPNRGSFDVERELLGELLASLVACFARTQARVDSPSDGNDCSEIVDVAPNNLRSICVSPVHFTEPARGPS